MAINAKNNNIDIIHWLGEASGVIEELQIAKVRKNNVLLWEYANSNFLSFDGFVIVSTDGLVFNGKREEA